MNSKMVICITGMPGSGKSLAADILKRKGFEIVEMGDAIREEMRRKHIEITNENMRNFAIEIRKKHGMAIVAKLTAKMIKKHVIRDKIAIIGIRNADELRYFKNVFKGFSTIEIYAPQKTRYARLRMRSRPDDPKNLREFAFREKKEARLGIASAIKVADYVVLNTGSVAQLKKSLSDLIKMLGHIRG